jgi:hypothetical protein
MPGSRLALTLLGCTCLLVIFLSACGGDDIVRFNIDERALIACTEECASRGQCGTLTGGQMAVLGNESGPAVDHQDRFYVDGTPVVVVERMERQLFPARNGSPLIGSSTPFPHIFYRVSSQEPKTAWVSEWCLARP